MGRFSYIPLEFEKIEEGSEREILLKKDTRDLYILDDYKVPVSITTLLHKDSSLLANGVSIMEEDIKRLRLKYQEYINRTLKLGEKLDRLIKEAETEIFNRVLGLESYKKYIDDFSQDVFDEWEDVKKQLQKILNDYKADLRGLLNMITNKYQDANGKYLHYLEMYNDYLRILEIMKDEINTILETLAKKMYSLGSGNGSFKGSINVNYTETAVCVCWFYWMSNSTIYPWYGPPKTWNDPPNEPNNFGGGIWHPISYPSDMNDDTAYQFFSTGSELVNLYWGGPRLGPDYFMSTTPRLNKYARQVNLVYHKNRNIVYDESFTYQVR